jgi:hypothetical protein
MAMLEGLTQAGKQTQWAMDDAAGSSGAARPTPSEVDRRGLGLFDLAIRSIVIQTCDIK